MIDKARVVIDRAASPFAFNPWVAVLGAPVMIAGLALNELRFGHSWSHVGLMVVAATLGQAVLAASHEFFRRVRAPWGRTISRRLVSTVGGLFVSSQLRIFAVIGLMMWWGLPNETPLWLRVTNSALIVVVGGLLAGAAFHTFDRYARLRVQLVDSLVEGQRALASQAAVADALRADFINSVDEQVRLTQQKVAERLEQLEGDIASGVANAEGVADALSTTDANWRELSHRLWSPEQSPATTRLSELLRLAASGPSFQPMLVPLAALIMFQLVFRPQWPLPDALLGSVLWGGLAAGFTVALNVLPRTGKYCRLFYLPLLLAYPGSGGVFFVLGSISIADQLTAFVTHFGVVAVIIIFALLTAVMRDRRAVVDYLSELIDSATLQRLAAESEVSALARQMSSELHSSVRAGFIAGMLRIQRALDDGNTVGALAEISALRQLLEKPFTADTPQGSTSRLRAVVDNWAGLLEITHNLDGVEIALEWEDQLSLVVYNALNDAVRHGNADRVWINLILSDHAVTITIDNDGSPLADDVQLGLGSAMMDRIATGGWSRGGLENGITRVRASFQTNPTSAP